MDEWETRRRLIDPALEAAGWSAVQYVLGADYEPLAGAKEAEARDGSPG